MKLLDRVRATIRTAGYSPRTEEAYVHWIVLYIRFHGVRHPGEMGEAEVVAFLNHVAVDRQLSASSQNQALAALMFLYRHVLGRQLEELGGITRAKTPTNLPVVLSAPEVRSVLAQLAGSDFLAAALMYGGGLRVSECAALRVKDVDLARLEVVIRRGKGKVDRITTLPATIVPDLRRQIARVAALGEEDAQEPRFVGVTMPAQLDRKFPRAPRDLAWQYLFPAGRRCTDERGRLWRHHRDVSGLQRALTRAVRRAGVTKKASCHTLRHSFATHLLDTGTDIRTVQKLMGHRSVRTTMIYLHLVGRGAYGTRSPLDLAVGPEVVTGAHPETTPQ